MHFHDPIPDPHPIGRQPLGERWRRAAIGEPVLIAMPGTGDAAVDDAAFANRTILMGTKIAERPDLGTVAKHGDALATRCGHDARALVGIEAGALIAIQPSAASGLPQSRSRHAATRCSTATRPKPPNNIAGMSGVCTYCMIPSATCITTRP